MQWRRRRRWRQHGVDGRNVYDREISFSFLVRVHGCDRNRKVRTFVFLHLRHFFRFFFVSFFSSSVSV